MRVLLNRWSKALHSRPVRAGLLLGLFLVTLSLTHLETLHAALHNHSSDPDHQCAVMMIKQGLLDTSAGHVTVLVPADLPIQPLGRIPTFVP